MKRSNARLWVHLWLLLAHPDGQFLAGGEGGEDLPIKFGLCPRLVLDLARVKHVGLSWFVMEGCSTVPRGGTGGGTGPMGHGRRQSRKGTREFASAARRHKAHQNETSTCSGLIQVDQG